MRSVVALLVVVIIAVAYLVADDVARHEAQSDVARRIEARVPGTSATVAIHSWPFTGRLAVTGEVADLQVHVTGLEVADVAVATVDLDVRDLAVDRGRLLDGTLALRSISRATVVATVTQDALDSATHLPVTLGQGTVGLGGIQIPADVSVADDRLDVGVLGLRTISLPLLPASLLPCTPSGRVVPGELVLSCTTSVIPPALSGAVGGG